MTALSNNAVLCDINRIHANRAFDANAHFGLEEGGQLGKGFAA